MSASGAYILMLLWPRDRVALPVTIFLLGYLSYMHIYKYLFEYMSWVMDETGMQMLMTAKLCSLAYCYQDAITIKKNPERLMDE
mmetsp:Transcript_6895/g.876  ORF Transcript_6895/g.876 Transcript_6895/m.876 type:complete len:84 (-) Transcript_6895:732-983(-)